MQFIEYSACAAWALFGNKNREVSARHAAPPPARIKEKRRGVFMCAAKAPDKREPWLPSPPRHADRRVHLHPAAETLSIIHARRRRCSFGRRSAEPQAATRQKAAPKLLVSSVSFANARRHDAF